MPGVMDVEVSDLFPESGVARAGCCCFSSIFFIFFILFVPGSVKQLGQFSYGITKNTVSGVVDLDNVYTPGRYYIGFWKTFVEIPSLLQTIQFSDQSSESTQSFGGIQQLGILRGRDKDGKQIYLDISVQYQLIPEEVGQIYRQMTVLYENVYISDLRDAFSKAANLFAISDAWEDFPSVLKLLKDACTAALKPRHAICWDLQLWGIRLETTYEAALVKTQVRKQAQRTAEAQKLSAGVRAETQVILSEYQKNITVIQSTGSAQQIIITREAQAAAEGNLIKAQAMGMQVIKDNLKVNGLSLNDTQLITYQRLLMLQSHKLANFVYQSPPASMEAVNVYSANRIMLGGRRLQSAQAAAPNADPIKRLPVAAQRVLDRMIATPVVEQKGAPVALTADAAAAPARPLEL